MLSPLPDWRVCVISDHRAAVVDIVQVKLSTPAVSASYFVGSTDSRFLHHSQDAVVADVISAAIRRQHVIEVAQTDRAAQLEVLWTVLILALNLLAGN
jgi:putative aminopeptidase FrvX